MPQKIYIIDKVVSAPGKAQSFVKSYLSEYAPGARGRGMVLDHILVSPPIWLEDGSNTITITWTLGDVSDWWNMTRIGRQDPTVGEWWEGISHLVAERSRSMAADPGDIEAMCDV